MRSRATILRKFAAAVGVLGEVAVLEEVAVDDASRHPGVRPGVRSLRLVLSLACLATCFAFAFFWVRSLYWHDALFSHKPGRYWELVSWNGRISFEILTTSAIRSEPISLSSAKAEEWQEMLSRLAAEMGQPEIARVAPWWRFEWRTTPRKFLLSAPNWSIVLLAGVFALAIKPKPRWQFSLFDLLVCVTFAGLLAGAVAILLG